MWPRGVDGRHEGAHVPCRPALARDVECARHVGRRRRDARFRDHACVRRPAAAVSLHHAAPQAENRERLAAAQLRKQRAPGVWVVGRHRSARQARAFPERASKRCTFHGLRHASGAVALPPLQIGNGSPLSSVRRSGQLHGSRDTDRSARGGACAASSSGRSSSRAPRASSDACSPARLRARASPASELTLLRALCGVIARGEAPQIVIVTQRAVTRSSRREASPRVLGPRSRAQARDACRLAVRRQKSDTRSSSIDRRRGAEDAWRPPYCESVRTQRSMLRRGTPRCG